jgi:hypothetical protein
LPSNCGGHSATVDTWFQINICSDYALVSRGVHGLGEGGHWEDYQAILVVVTDILVIVIINSSVTSAMGSKSSGMG